MDSKELVLELKGEVAEDGSFEGIASVYGNVDSQGDRIEAGAFADQDGAQVPLLWSHKRDEPVGLGKLVHTAAGVLIKGKLDLDTTAGREAYSRLQKGIVKGLSIGLQLIQHAYDGAVRVIRKGAIREVSLVLFPANPAAMVTAVKKEGESPAAELLRYC
jgi:HK97 family phage prohead protease